jgi:hypothetical protein
MQALNKLQRHWSLMNKQTNFSTLTVCFLILAFSLTACSTAPYRYQPLDSFAVTDRAETQQEDSIRVSASVPGKEEAEAIFGIPLYKRGIQPVWLEIENGSDQRVRFAPISVDRNYFSPLEVAYMHKKGYSEEARGQMDRRFSGLSIPRQILPGETVSGFVFTHAAKGTKAFNVDVFAAGNARDYQFTFFVDVPGFVADHAEVDFKGLYPEEEIEDFDIPGFHSELQGLAFPATDRTGEQPGLPVNVVFVSRGLDLLQALLRAHWNESSVEKEEPYLSNAQHLFGRPPDATFRKHRDSSKERNQLNLWLAPMRVDGKPVWLGQIRQAIGKRTQLEQISEFLMGTRLDPDMDDSRHFLLQNFWYSQGLEQFAWSDSGHAVPITDTRTDFSGNEYFTDGIRIVLWISGDVMSLKDVRYLKWESLPVR